LIISRKCCIIIHSAAAFERTRGLSAGHKRKTGVKKMESKGSIGGIIKRLEEKLGPVFEVSSKSAKDKKWDKKKPVRTGPGSVVRMKTHEDGSVTVYRPDGTNERRSRIR
jgi:hypothetical protein